MSVKIDLLNETYVGEELIIEEFSGALEDMSDEVKEVLTLEDAEGLEAGHWITVLDGEVIEASEFHPFRVQVD